MSASLRRFQYALPNIGLVCGEGKRTAGHADADGTAKSGAHHVACAVGHRHPR